MKLISKEELIANRRKNLQTLANMVGGAAALARKCDRSVQQISDMLAGRKTFGERVARSLEQALELDVGSLDATAIDANVKSTPKSNSYRMIPVLNSVQAGYPSDAGHDDYSDWIAVDESTKESVFAMEVKGDSMEPLFSAGDVVLADSDRSASPGDFVIAKSRAGFLPECTLKKYKVIGYSDDGQEIFDLIPLNPDYPVLNSEKHQLEVVGVVTECRKRF